MHFTVVFDAASMPRDPLPLLGTAALISLGIALLWLGPKSPIGPTALRHGAPKAWRVFLAAFVALLVLVFAGRLWTLLRPLPLDDVKVVEGMVQDFSPPVLHGSNWEAFAVNGVRFRYADTYNNGGFHQTSIAGGPIRGGLLVRIHYSGPAKDPTIVRLEVSR